MRLEELEKRVVRLGTGADCGGAAGDGVADWHQLRAVGDVAAGTGERTHPELQADHEQAAATAQKYH
jgi:hypothetical protein